MAGGRSVGHVSPRRKGVLLELLTSRLAEATPEDLEGTRTRQNQTVLLVTGDNVARALVAVAVGA